MPALTTVYKWARDNKEFAADLQDARKTGAATWLDRCLELLEQKDIPPNQIQLLRESLHHYRWLASKLTSSSQQTHVLAHGNGVQKQLDNPESKTITINEA